MRGAGVRYPFFGISPDEYDVGTNPCCAINASGVVVEIHQAQLEKGDLYWSVGQVEGVTLRWTGHDPDKYDDGAHPSVALYGNVVLEVHDTTDQLIRSPNCWYRTGRVVGSSIDWDGEHDEYADGKDPAVAVNRNGVVVEVHNGSDNDSLYWRVGQLTGTALEWNGSGTEEFEATTPSIAVNGAGVVVQVHEFASKLKYAIGQVRGDRIEWHGEREYDSGSYPSVALTEDNYVFEIHEGTRRLFQRVGRVVGDVIEWNDYFGNDEHSNYVDAGTAPQIATNGKVAIQTHMSETVSMGLHANASLVVDRASWMEDHLGTLGSRTLRQIAMPGSHDAGMYTHGIETLGKTQDLDIYSQLVDGVRYFDLRPQYEDDDDEFYIHHGEGVLNVVGPKLTDVLDDIARFMLEGHRELAVLKFSHYEHFDQSIFDDMCVLIVQKLGAWFYTGWTPGGKRLADTTLNEYLGARGTALVVCDEPYTIPTSINGLYVYRDWQSENPREAQLTVFDIYSATMFFDVMAYSTDTDEFDLPRGQIPKFEVFNGRCKDNSMVPCDLFLLSWTLTPPTAVWPESRIANKNLVDNMAAIGANADRRVINILYVDYVEYARGTDVAMVRNGIAP
jgi:hypothetical protein